MDYINELHELCETISREIADANEKIRNAGGKLSSGDVDYVDKLTHTLKSIKATIAMMEDEDGYSGNYPMGGNRDPYMWNGGGYSRVPDGGNSFRGRGTYAKRDSMGRYSGRYSRGSDLVSQLHDMMQDAPNDQIKREMQRLADSIEQSK